MFCHTISCLNIPISAFQWKWPPLWPYTGRNYTSLSYSLSLSLFFPFNIREEMRSLQAALQKQLDEAAERAEKHQATVRHLNKWRWKMMECFCSSDSSSIWWRQNDHYPHLNSNAQGVDLIFNFFLWRLAQSRRLIIVLLFSSQCRQRPLHVLLTQNSLWGMFISEGPDTALAILSPDFYGYSVLIMQTHSVIFALELFSPARWVLRVREREGPLWDTRDRRRVSSRIWMNPWGEWKWAWGCTFPSMNSSKQTSLN